MKLTIHTTISLAAIFQVELDDQGGVAVTTFSDKVPISMAPSCMVVTRETELTEDTQKLVMCAAIRELLDHALMKYSSALAAQGFDRITAPNVVGPEGVQ